MLMLMSMSMTCLANQVLLLIPATCMIKLERLGQNRALTGNVSAKRKEENEATGYLISPTGISKMWVITPQSRWYHVNEFIVILKLIQIVHVYDLCYMS